MGEGETEAPAKSGRFAGPHAFAAWLNAMHERGTSVNFGSFVGAGTIRAYVKGMSQGEPTPEEIETMQTLVRQAMEDGAFGIGSALIYPPGNYATTHELGQMAKAMAPYGGVYITHMRSEADHVLEAIDEAIGIGRAGGVPVEIYHLKEIGKRNWDKVSQVIAKIDLARAGGIDVAADMYPYIAGGTGLTACLPPWTAADGKLFDNLADAKVRVRIQAEIQSEKNDWENMGRLAGPEGILIVGVEKPENRKFVGKRLSEIAAMQHKDWMDAAMDLILSDHSPIETLYFMMKEENVKRQLQQPWIKIGTDAEGLDPDNTKSMAHPRSYGTYPRILGKYVRDEQVISLEDAVRKMSSAVARRLSIQDRGLLQEGMYADIAVFDPATIIDRATFEQPHQLSTGVRYVFVNGVDVVREGRTTGAKPGRIVRGPGYVEQWLPKAACGLRRSACRR
jgi:dihydroorotase/N-acyl-D-amino-acid deacylase